jgi:hypothetical protein
VATGWQLTGFRCAPETSVAALCAQMSTRVLNELIEPLCVSALNTPAHRASGQVFLRVMKDALFGVQGGSRLLLPRQDLSALLPNAAADWVTQRGGELRMGARVDAVVAHGSTWVVQDQLFDGVIFATNATESTRALDNSAQAATDSIATQMRKWVQVTRGLQFEAITTVYAWSQGATLPHPMLTLRSHEQLHNPMPAQFVFDRGQLDGPAGLLAFVVSASHGDRQALETQVLQQAQSQLGLTLQAVQTIVEKRATFACTPGLQRPSMQIAPGLVACGDYIDGPYPATLEGAVRSGQAAAAIFNG